MQSIFGIGTVKLKDNSGTLQVRNAADDAFVNIQALNIAEAATENFTYDMSTAAIQAVIDTYNDTTIEKDLTFNFGAGTYSAGTLDFTNSKTIRGAKVKLVASDTRAYCGYSFIDGQVTDPDISASATTLALASDTITVGPSAYDFDAEGRVAGDTFVLTGRDAADAVKRQTMTVASISGQDIVCTAAPSEITQLLEGSSLTWVSNSIITQTITIDCEKCDFEFSKGQFKIDSTSSPESALNSYKLTNVVVAASSNLYYSDRCELEKCSFDYTGNLYYCKNLYANKIYFTGYATGQNLNFSYIEGGIINVFGNNLGGSFLDCKLLIKSFTVKAQLHGFGSMYNSEIIIQDSIFHNSHPDAVGTPTGQSIWFESNSKIVISNTNFANWANGVVAYSGVGIIKKSSGTGVTFTNCTADHSPASTGNFECYILTS